jgi:hypothetical protein
VHCRVYTEAAAPISRSIVVLFLSYNNSAIRPSSSVRVFSQLKILSKNIYVIHHRFTVQCHHSLLCLKTIVCSSNRRIAQGHCAWCIGQQQQQLCKGVGITQMIRLGFTLPFSWTNVGLFPLFDIFCSRCVCVCRL